LKCLALFSGGLDSLLAIKLIERQGVEVIPIMFKSYFFGLDEKSIKTIFDFKVELIDISKEHLGIVYNPCYGYGKNINPCIDCHSFMLRKTGELLKSYNAKFIITGEVLGQRPMSQNQKALRLVETVSGFKGLILRPLSAKNLEITIPEREGWVDRNKLLDIRGRNRKTQLKLLSEFNIKKYIKPGGGCLLTVPTFAKRVEIMKEDNVYDPNILNAIRFGRLLRLDRGLYIIVGRNESDNKRLKMIKSDLFLEPYDTPGPCITVFGSIDKNVIDFCKFLFLFYSKAESAYVYINGILENIFLSNTYDFRKFMIC